jgi:Signal transduction histidine kinase
MTFPEPAPAGHGPAPAEALGPARARAKKGAGRFGAPAAQARTIAGLFAVPARDWRFWAVQGLVLVIAAGHVALEMGGALLGWTPLYLLPVSVFFIPAMYASLVFGQRGAIPTVLWCWVLSLPTIIFYHTPAEEAGVNLQLSVMLMMAILVGRKVDRERRASSVAAAVNAQLRELNATAGAASCSLDLEQVFSATIQVILRRQALGSAWIVYAPDGWESRSVVALSSASPCARELPAACLQATRRVIEGGQPCTSAVADGANPESEAPRSVVVVPVTADDKVVGGLGVAGLSETMWTHDVAQLGAVAQQLGLAVDNSRHCETARSALRELAGSQAALQKYVQLATDAQEAERKRLARELHDETIQMLVVARGSLEVACRQPVSAADPVADTITTLDHAIAGLRRVCRDLRPSILDDLGLTHALEALTVELADRADMQVSLTCVCDEQRLDARTEVVLYRIAQEALHNIERHAGAAHAAVTLIARPDAVALRVTDDGRGFKPLDGAAGPTETSHLGLLGMQERARSLGGVLTIESSPGAGTLVEVRAPGM